MVSVRRVLTLSAMVAVAVMFACRCIAAEAMLARDGKAVGVIVHNGHTALSPQIPEKPLGVGKGIMKPAMEDLQHYLKEITGAELPLVATAEEAGDKPAIVLELVDKVPGASDRDTGDQAYRIHTEGNRLVLTAANLLGLHNAVYGLLEDHLGCRFYTYRLRQGGHGASFYEGPGFEVVPKQPSLSIGAIDDFQEPALACRGLIFRMGGYPWILKNRAIGVGGHVSGALAAGHTMYSWINPEDKDVWMRNKEGKRERVTKKGLFEDHPEFFPMNKQGKRDPDMHNQGVCGTAQGLPAHLAKRIFESLGSAPKDASNRFQIGQGDGFQGCHCPDCRKLV